MPLRVLKRPNEFLATNLRANPAVTRRIPPGLSFNHISHRIRLRCRLPPFDLDHQAPARGGAGLHRLLEEVCANVHVFSTASKLIFKRYPVELAGSGLWFSGVLAFQPFGRVHVCKFLEIDLSYACLMYLFLPSSPRTPNRRDLRGGSSSRRRIDPVDEAAVCHSKTFIGLDGNAQSSLLWFLGRRQPASVSEDEH